MELVKSTPMDDMRQFEAATDAWVGEHLGDVCPDAAARRAAVRHLVSGISARYGDFRAKRTKSLRESFLELLASERIDPGDMSVEGSRALIDAAETWAETHMKEHFPNKQVRDTIASQLVEGIRKVSLHPDKSPFAEKGRRTSAFG